MTKETCLGKAQLKTLKRSAEVYNVLVISGTCQTCKAGLLVQRMEGATLPKRWNAQIPRCLLEQPLPPFPEYEE